jgi:steroid 5-alpha reductase family enzyme
MSKARRSSSATASSWLDRLQKDAQARELHPGNTSSGRFLSLVFAQSAFVAIICRGWLVDPRFHWAAIVGIGSHWFGFAMSITLRTCKYFDITEDLSLMYMLLGVFITPEETEQVLMPALSWVMPRPVWPPGPFGGGPRSSRQSLALGLSLLWCIRLVAFVGYRVLVRGRDFRFDNLMRGKAFNLFGWTSGGVWCWVNPFCLWVLASVKDARPLAFFDFVGVLVFSFGLLLETLSDIQKYFFNVDHKSGENKKFIRSGLWSWSRHPNYVGEITAWIGLAIICSQADGVWGTRNMFLVAVSPIFSCFFLVFTSLMLLEKRGDKKWGKNKIWNEYKKSTPVLFPSSLPPWECYRI